MKKSTLNAIYNFLNGNETVDLSVVRDEVNAEWQRLNAKQEANRNAYKEAEAITFSILSDKPMTAKEIFEASDKWPQGFTHNKVQYALLNYWNDRVEKIENPKGANTYKIKR